MSEVPRGRVSRWDGLLTSTTQHGLAAVYASLPCCTLGLVGLAVVTLGGGLFVLLTSACVLAETGAALD